MSPGPRKKVNKEMMFDVRPVLNADFKVREILMTSRNGVRRPEAAPNSAEQLSVLRVKKRVGFKDSTMDQIWTRYKGTRDHLSNTDSACVTKFKQDSQGAMDKIEEEMEKIRSDVDGLFLRFMKLASKAVERENELELVRSLTAPSRTTPPEILRIIFRMCLADTEDGLLVSKHIAMPLSQVCRSWRDVAINDDLLWFSHGITIPDPEKVDDRSFGKRTALLDMFRARSGRHSKHLRLSVHDLTQSFNQPLQHAQIMDMLLFTFRQYEHISFQDLSTTWYDYFEENQDRVDAKTFENLSSLSLTIPTTLADTRDLLFIFRDAPKLRKVKLDLFDPHVALTILLPPELLSLDFRVKRDRNQLGSHQSIGHEMWRNLLRDHPNLRSASIDIAPEDVGHAVLDPLAHMESITASNIQTLSAINSLPGDVSCLLRNIRLPKLKSLRFEASGAFCLLLPNEPAHDYLHFLTSSLMYFDLDAISSAFRNLTSLTLLRVFAMKGDIRPIFEGMKSLERLEIFLASTCPTRDQPQTPYQTHSSAEDRGFLEQLAEPPLQDDPTKERYLLPKLRDLTLYHKCHLGAEAGVERVGLYSTIINSRSKAMGGSPTVGSNGFHFTLMLSNEHRMTAELPWIMRTMWAASSHVPQSAINYNIVETFEWKHDGWLPAQPHK